MSSIITESEPEARVREDWSHWTEKQALGDWGHVAQDSGAGQRIAWESNATFLNFNNYCWIFMRVYYEINIIFFITQFI